MYLNIYDVPKKNYICIYIHKTYNDENIFVLSLK
jgi:hypothetical protein